MCKTVQHGFACGQLCHCKAVVLLVQKEAGFLPVLKVHGIRDAVFIYLCYRALGVLLKWQVKPFLTGFKPFQRPDGHVISLIDAFYDLSVLPQNLHEEGIDHLSDLFHAYGEHLCHQHVVETVHCQAGKPVCLTEDQAAAGDVFSHRGLPVFPRIADSSFPEGSVKPVIGIA